MKPLSQSSAVGIVISVGRVKVTVPAITYYSPCSSLSSAISVERPDRDIALCNNSHLACEILHKVDLFVKYTASICCTDLSQQRENPPFTPGRMLRLRMMGQLRRFRYQSVVASTLLESRMY